MEKHVFIRLMPTELWRKVKAQAALEGTSLRGAVIEALTLWLKDAEPEDQTMPSFQEAHASLVALSEAWLKRERE